MTQRKTTEEFIQQAIAVHGDKYDYSLAEHVNAKTKVKIICPLHGLFEQTPDGHINSAYGCYDCGIKTASSKRKRTTKEFIRQAKAIHGDKYDYSQTEYINVKSSLKINCPVHGLFWQTPEGHLTGRGCRKCGIKTASSKRRKKTECFIEEAKSVHGERYDYSKTEYIKAKIKVKIVCPSHGVFEQEPSNHLCGKGCPKCKNEFISSQKRGGVEDFVRKAKIVHGDKYDYSLVSYILSNIKIKIICPEHTHFMQTPAHHLMGQGCPKCASHGFNSHKPGVIYLLKFQTDIASFWKIGITNRTVAERFCPNDRICVKTGYQWQCEGTTAHELEQGILKSYGEHKINYLFPLLSSGGDSECFGLTLPHRKIIKEITAKLGKEPEKVCIGLSDSLEFLAS
jgi:Zn finger protein HypA/HybF involved in hydrogenase expression